MSAQQQNEKTCEQCGAPVPADVRYCLVCYSPVAGASAARAHVELARKTPTTHRVDPTIVFSPEKHEAIERARRRRKRAIIGAASAVLLLIGSSIVVSVISRNRLAAAKAEARAKSALRDLSTIREALERFRSDVGRYPTNAEGLAVLEIGRAHV